MKAETHKQRWMLVDDNTELLTMLSAIVQHFTVAIVECYDSPQAALSAFAAAPDSYELVITDFEMPGMNGVEFCHRLHSISAIQKIFLATGSRYISEEAAWQYGFNALLNKPFPLIALKEALTTVGLARETAYVA